MIPLAETHLVCPQCGYNLTALTSKKCPECGAAIDIERLRREGLPPRFDCLKWAMQLFIAPTIVLLCALPPMASLYLVPLGAIPAIIISSIFAYRLSREVSDIFARRYSRSAIYHSSLFLIPATLVFLSLQLMLCLVAACCGLWSWLRHWEGAFP